LHPLEAYVLVQRVDGLAPGLYHYQAIEHALEPLDVPAASDFAAWAHELVAGQTWFAMAPVQILLAARFDRSFWKYRNHAKAWRVLHLDAGHLSQTLYLSATEQGLGAFITAAINDDCAERIFGLDGLSQGALAVCGFGPRIPGRFEDELNSAGKVAGG
jgi:putative peptide maturation dehydrogenase